MDLIQGMYVVVYGLVRVSVTSIRGRSVYQGYVRSSQLFIVVLDAFSKWMGRFQLFALKRKGMMHWTKPTIED